MKRSIATLTLLSLVSQSSLPFFARAADDKILTVDLQTGKASLTNEVLWPALVQSRAARRGDPSVDFKTYVIGMAINSNPQVDFNAVVSAANEVTKQYESLQAKAAGNYKIPSMAQDLANLALIAGTGILAAGAAPEAGAGAIVAAGVSAETRTAIAAALKSYGSTVLKMGMGQLEKSMAPTQQLAAQEELLRLSDSFQSVSGPFTLSDLLKMGVTRPEVFPALAVAFGVDPRLNVEQYEKLYPEYFSESRIKELHKILIENGGIEGIRADQKKAAKAFAALAESINKELRETRKSISDLSSKYETMMRSTKDEKERQKIMEARAQELAQKQLVDELTVPAAYSSVYILSTLVGLGDKKLGHQMQVVGNATVKIYEAAKNFEKVLSSPAITNLAAGLGGAVMAGNIFGAVMSIASLFINQPDPMEQISKQIADLHKEVNEMHKEMHDRFNHTDKMIGELYKMTAELLQEVLYEVRGVASRVEATQQDVLMTLNQLYRLQASTNEQFSAYLKYDFDKHYNHCVDVRRMISIRPKSDDFRDFVECIMDFRTFGITGSTAGADAIEYRDPLTQAMSYGEIARTLKERSLILGSGSADTLPPEERLAVIQQAAQAIAPETISANAILASPIRLSLSARAIADAIALSPKSYLKSADLSKITSSMQKAAESLQSFSMSLRHPVPLADGTKTSVALRLLQDYDTTIAGMKKLVQDQTDQITARELGDNGSDHRARARRQRY